MLKAIDRLRSAGPIGALQLLVLLVLWDLYGLDFIPFTKIFGDSPWNSITYHALSAICSAVFIFVLCPTALKRIKHRPDLKTFAFGVVVIGVIASNFFTEVLTPGFPIWEIAEAILFCLCIGLGEEFFSRGLVFGLFERFGVGWAIGISSVEFGLSHFTNMVWGHQDFAQTSAQALNATAFGFLAAALMIFTGSIWFGIVMHGLSDYSLVTTSASQAVKNLTAPVDWVAVIVEMVIYLAIGTLLLYMKSVASAGNKSTTEHPEALADIELQPIDFALERIRGLKPDSQIAEYLLEIAWLYDRIVQAGSQEPVIDLSYELVLPLEFVAECVRRAMDARLIKLPVKRSNGGRISLRALRKLKLIA